MVLWMPPSRAGPQLALEHLLLGKDADSDRLFVNSINGAPIQSAQNAAGRISPLMCNNEPLSQSVQATWKSMRRSTHLKKLVNGDLKSEVAFCVMHVNMGCQLRLFTLTNRSGRPYQWWLGSRCSICSTVSTLLHMER